MNSIKNAWKSITIWFNGISASIIMMADTLKDNLPFAQAYVTPEIMKYAAIAVVAVNVALRFKTNKSLADK